MHDYTAAAIRGAEEGCKPEVHTQQRHLYERGRVQAAAAQQGDSRLQFVPDSLVHGY